MWIVRGLLLGSGLFAMGTLVFLKLTLFGQVHGTTATSLRALQGYTTQNPFFWIALVACLALGVSIIGSLPVRIPSS
jgi:hypothetical protein